MKHQDKVMDSLKKRQQLFTPGKADQGLLNHKPGSQNRRKGYKRDAARKRG